MDERRDNWYSNKELHANIIEFQNKMVQLEVKLDNTLRSISKYNGLWEKQQSIEQRVTAIEKEESAKDRVSQSIRAWGGWIAAMITFILLLRKEGIL
ncbi:MAG: hypothetical protein ACLKAO_03930 [Alkaliphilus sp.]